MLKLNANIIPAVRKAGRFAARAVMQTSAYAKISGVARSLAITVAVITSEATAAIKVSRSLSASAVVVTEVSAALAENQLLLDLYPGAETAYSVRKLRNAYSGPLVEIRRSSDNALKDFYPDSNGELSLTSEDGSGTTLGDWVSTDDGYVRTWYDQTANTNNATQTSSSAQPEIISGGALLTAGTKPALDFTATATSLILTTNLFAATETEVSVFGAIQTSITNAHIVGTGSGGTGFLNSYGFGVIMSSNRVVLKANDNSVGLFLQATTTVYSTLKTFAALFNANSSVEVDGVEENTSSTALNPWAYSRTTIGGSMGNSGTAIRDAYNGKLPELIIYHSDQGANASGIEANQSNYF